MSDISVAAALRSNARLVVIESPAGCGKTYQGAEYARDAVPLVGRGRILVLAHTHAACDVFASRTLGLGGRIDIRTIDSLIVQIATIYHSTLQLPADVGAWARNCKDSYRELAGKVAQLLRFSPMIARSIAVRYPIIVCDEHQDANSDQETILMACLDGGASVRVFGDPMQRIFGSKKKADIEADSCRWNELVSRSDKFDKLDKPYRWSGASEQLGCWILAARETLRTGGRVDLRGSLPKGVSVLFAENQAPRYGAYLLASGEGTQIRKLANDKNSILILSAHNSTVDSMRAFLGRRVPIWEGHVRDGLSALVKDMESNTGEATKIAESAINFVQYVATGFSSSAYGTALMAEVRNGCVARRKLMPAKLQTLGRIFLEEPNHRGVARFLYSVEALARTDSDFSQVKLDCQSEFWDAVRLGEFECPSEGFAEISRRRSSMPQSLPPKALSTIHKAKGLECDNVLIVPCDTTHFGDTYAARCNLYVAMSRATRSLTIVASRRKPSPLVIV